MRRRTADGGRQMMLVAGLVLLMLGPAVAPAHAQQPDSSRASRSMDAQAQLVARGLPAGLASDVAVVARETDAKGLPGQAVVDKAVEGWFKHVPPPRILGAVRDLSRRLERARADLVAGGVRQPSGAVIAGSADATAQAVSRGDQVNIINAAPDGASAASGLSVAAALVVQGLDPATSARLVSESFRHGRSLAQVLDLPAAARALQVRGTATNDVGRQLLEGITSSVGVQGRVGAVVKPIVPAIP